MAENKDCGALWMRSKEGKDYMTGNIIIEGTIHEIVVFKNSYKKEGDKTPDWRIYPSKPRADVADKAMNAMFEGTRPEDIPF